MSEQSSDLADCGLQNTRMQREKLPPRNISDSDDPCAELRDKIERLRAELAIATKRADEWKAVVESYRRSTTIN